MITDIMLNEDYQPIEAVDFLEDLEDACRDAGVPFSELLGEDMYIGNVPPIRYEILRCDYQTNPELLMYLVTRTRRVDLDALVRAACLSRDDNFLFQMLRDTMGYNADKQISSSGHDTRFEVLFNINELVKGFTPPPLSEKQRLAEKLGDKEKPAPPQIEFEWIAAQRAWKLVLTRETISLSLLQGDPMTIGGSIAAIFPADNANAVNMPFPSEALLKPMSMAGRNSLVIRPTPPPADWPQLATDGDILIQLDVEAVKLPPPSDPIKAPSPSEPEAPIIVEHPVEEQPTKPMMSNIDDDDWVIEYDDAPIDRDDTPNPEWVLASYSGKDADADE